MTRHLISAAAFAVLAFSSVSALAQEAATVMVSESGDYGQYLVDADGRSLYLFTDDTQAQGDTPAMISCAGGCLENWPPLYTEGAPKAGDGVDAAMLGTVGNDGGEQGQMMVSYNGWPLYYFAGDTEAGQTAGQGRGEKWFLVAPSGEMAGK